MPSLYEISNEVQHVLAQCDDDGEIPLDLADKLNGLQLSVSGKVEALCRYMKQSEADAIAVEVEAKRLHDMQKRLEGKAAWIKDYLKTCLQAAGIDRIDVPLFSLRIQKNSRPTITVVDGKPIPEEFVRVKLELDGNAAYAAWKSGQQLPPELKVDQGTHLRIR